MPLKSGAHKLVSQSQDFEYEEVRHAHNKCRGDCRRLVGCRPVIREEWKPQEHGYEVGKHNEYHGFVKASACSVEDDRLEDDSQREEDGTEVNIEGIQGLF